MVQVKVLEERAQTFTDYEAGAFCASSYKLVYLFFGGALVLGTLVSTFTVVTQACESPESPEAEVLNSKPEHPPNPEQESLMLNLPSQKANLFLVHMDRACLGQRHRCKPKPEPEKGEFFKQGGAVGSLQMYGDHKLIVGGPGPPHPVQAIAGFK